MRQTQYLCVLLRLLSVATAQTATYSIGHPTDYIAKPTQTPSLSGSEIYFDGGATGKDGIDVTFSPDLQKKLKQAIKANCQKLDDKCFQSVRSQLSNQDTELQARNPLLIFAFAIVALGILIPAVDLYSTAPDKIVPIHIPANLASQASSAASATAIIVTVDSTPAFTITPKPAPTGVTGSVKPAVTTFASASDGHQKGDVLISLPTDLAKQLDDFIRRATQCNLADTFKSGPTKRAADLGAVLCGAQGIIVNAQAGGVFADLRLLNPQPLPFTAADAVRAMNVAVDFARNYASALQLSPDAASLVGVAAFAIAYEVWFVNKPVAAANIIPAASLKGTPTTTQKSTCTECAASCSFAGALQVCETTCSPKSTNACKTDISTTAIVYWTVYTEASATPLPPPPKAPPAPPITLAGQGCYPEGSVGDHGDIHGDVVDERLRYFCMANYMKTVTPNSGMSVLSNYGLYHFVVYWIDGCKNGPMQQSLSNPIPGNTDVSCNSILYDNYHVCNNGGIGGYKDAGCLRYVFKGYNGDDIIL